MAKRKFSAYFVVALSKRGIDPKVIAASMVIEFAHETVRKGESISQPMIQNPTRVT